MKEIQEGFGSGFIAVSESRTWMGMNQHEHEQKRQARNVN
jgi:hypothetical protein